ncbi:MAG: hypothetical protein ACTS73_08010 [Arsenophonus sp. NEOnobi-MAG3]
MFSYMNVFDNLAFLLHEQTVLAAEIIRTAVMMKLEAVELSSAGGNLMLPEVSSAMVRRADSTCLLSLINN